MGTRSHYYSLYISTLSMLPPNCGFAPSLAMGGPCAQVVKGALNDLRDKRRLDYLLRRDDEGEDGGDDEFR